MTAFQIAISLLAGSALLISIVTLGLRIWTQSDRDQFTRELASQSMALAELTDRVTHWMQKENARRAREGKQERAAEQPDPGLDATSRKAQLRSRARQLGLSR